MFVPLVLGLALAVTSCAPAGTRARGDMNVITREELAASNTTDLYQAVQRLRPRWLTVRSSQTFGVGAGQTAILVYQNQTRLGGIDVLRQLDPQMAEWLQYLDGPTASAALPGIGSQDVEGAIVIHTTPRDTGGSDAL